VPRLLGGSDGKLLFNQSYLNKLAVEYDLVPPDGPRADKESEAAAVTPTRRLCDAATVNAQECGASVQAKHALYMHSAKPVPPPGWVSGLTPRTGTPDTTGRPYMAWAVPEFAICAARALRKTSA
jgi:hypothetical protein